jgi:hypothetical protein
LSFADDIFEPHATVPGTTGGAEDGLATESTAANALQMAISTPGPVPKRSPLSVTAADAISAAADAVSAFAMPMMSMGDFDAAAGDALGNAGDDDDEVSCVVTGSTGANTLSDFPHARENCANFKFSPSTQAPTNLDHCRNCFCFVCDAPVVECGAWPQHAHACCANAHWLGQRHRNQLRLGTVLAATGDDEGGSSTSTAPAPRTSRDPEDFAGLAPLDPSCHALLQRIEQVWPVE